MFDDIEDKFIVINKKRFEEMYHRNWKEHPDDVVWIHGKTIINRFKDSFNKFVTAWEQCTGKEMNQKYIVINQDEPYAEEVWNIIKNYEKMNSFTFIGDCNAKDCLYFVTEEFEIQCVNCVSGNHFKLKEKN